VYTETNAIPGGVILHEQMEVMPEAAE